MTNQRDQLVTGVLAVGLTAVFAAVMYVPQQRRIRSLRASATALSEQFQQRASRVGGTAALERRVQQLETDLSDFNTAVPPAAGLGPFLERVTDLAGSQGVQAPEITPAEPQTGPQVEVLPIEMSFVGSFDSVYGFLASIESQPRLARVSRLDLGRAEGQSEVLTANVTVQVYYRNRAQDESLGG